MALKNSITKNTGFKTRDSVFITVERKSIILPQINQEPITENQQKFSFNIIS